MDWVGMKKKTLDAMGKYKYALGILVLGIALMLIPGKISTSSNETLQETAVVEQTDLANDLAKILCRIDGVGQVEVLLTLAAGEQTIYQQDTDIANGDTGTDRHETVIITDGDRAQSGLIQQVNPPSYLGAIVVCQGADSPSVKLAVVEAVSRVTGLGADRISVLKMK